MKPLIGVIPLWDDEKESIWMLPGYMDGIEEAGGIPFIFPFTEDEEEIERLISVSDGLLLTGGHDVSPLLYNEKPYEGLIDWCTKRDTLELIAIKKAIEKRIPIFGICRGIQLLNVYFGGSLYQDLPTDHPSSIVHSQNPPYDKSSHTVSILKESPLFDLLKKEEIGVNSYHHQAVKELVNGLKAMAYSPDGLVEALYKEDYPFLWAVQWHPEFSHLVNDDSKLLFKAFVDAAR